MQKWGAPDYSEQRDPCIRGKCWVKLQKESPNQSLGVLANIGSLLFSEFLQNTAINSLTKNGAIPLPDNARISIECRMKRRWSTYMI